MTERHLDLTGIKIVSWDMDGTLYTIRHLIQEMFGLWASRVFERRLYQNLKEFAQLQRFRRAMARVRASGGEIDAAGLRAIKGKDLGVEQRWYGQAIHNIGPRAGVVETIERINSAGVRLIVVSDYRCDYKLRALGLDHRFERVFAGEELGFLKPSPKLFEIVAREAKVAPDQILHIGDRAETDGVAAELAGCKSLILESNTPVLCRVFKTDQNQDS